MYATPNFTAETERFKLECNNSRREIKVTNKASGKTTTVHPGASYQRYALTLEISHCSGFVKPLDEYLEDLVGHKKNVYGFDFDGRRN